MGCADRNSSRWLRHKFGIETDFWKSFDWTLNDDLVLILPFEKKRKSFWGRPPPLIRDWDWGFHLSTFQNIGAAVQGIFTAASTLSEKTSDKRTSVYPVERLVVCRRTGSCCCCGFCCCVCSVQPLWLVDVFVRSANVLEKRTSIQEMEGSHLHIVILRPQSCNIYDRLSDYLPYRLQVVLQECDDGPGPPV